MSKEKIIKHIEDTREIKKSNIYGIYPVSFFAFLTSMMAIYEGFELLGYFIAFLLIGIMIFSIVYLQVNKYNFKSRLVGQALSMIILIVSFMFMSLYIVVDEYGYTMNLVYLFILGQIIISIFMFFYVKRIFHKGFRKWQSFLIPILSSITPYSVYLFLRATGVQEYISIDLGMMIMMVCLGLIVYGPIDNFMKVYYLNKYNLDIKVKEYQNRSKLRG